MIWLVDIADDPDVRERWLTPPVSVVAERKGKVTAACES
jgi:hypothetical protein